ncbi:MAG: sugar ABC transporter ATP-binding protein [Verrucomicrobia bacterium]|nr:sugar ABC transporter ATP-binding protein [Verrucomicrobiota bacterium]
MKEQDRRDVLAVQGLRKTFGDTVALDNVTFNLYAGEVHCLVGENGAGKSTLIKILSGAERPDKGRIIAFGREYGRLTPGQSLDLGIATIYQDVELVTSLTVADNIFLGHEVRSRFGLIDYPAQNRKARELMDSLNIGIPETALVEHLSPAQQQTLQIVKALHISAKILIMDEPTSSLGVEETRALMGLVRQLAARNIGIIYISHYFEEVFEIGDRITVLKDGQVVNTFDARSTDLATITRSMIGREPALFYDRAPVETGAVILKVRGLGRHGLFEDVSFDLHRGEILGFGGVVGAGRSELMNVIFGADQRSSGEVILNGVPADFRAPRQSIGKGVAMLPEDRKALGLFDLRPVLENMAIVSNEADGLILDTRKEISAVETLINRLRIATAGIWQPIGFLSGGNQQKAILARWLLSHAQVFIFDEPTKGVDIGAKQQIYELMVELARQGKGILMVSSDMPELISVSDRIVVMRDGRQVTTVDSKSITEHELLGSFLGTC